MGHDATNVSWDPSGCCEDSSLEGAKEKQLRDDGGLDQGGGSGNNSDWLLSRCFFCRQSQQDSLMNWVKNIRAREKSSMTIGIWMSHWKDGVPTIKKEEYLENQEVSFGHIKGERSTNIQVETLSRQMDTRVCTSRERLGLRQILGGHQHIVF